MSLRRTLTALAVATALTGGAAGCGLPDRVAGLHDAPTEAVGGAPLNETTAQEIAARVVADAAVAAAKTGPAGAAARKATMTGSALAMAEAVRSSKVRTTAPGTLTKPAAPKVLAISKGQRWPRTIVVTSLDDATSTQSLQVLTSATPTARFVLAASVPMIGGASVPAIGTVADGVTAVTDGKGMVGAPKDVLAQYAGALAYPKPAAARSVALTDPLSVGLRSGASAQAARLGRLAAYAQRHAVVAADTTAFRLADGGALVFGELTRTDTITPRSGAKELTLPADIATLVGKAKTTKPVTVTYLETVVLVLPAAGQATVIGAQEQLASAKST